jgi:hypothetical protein
MMIDTPEMPEEPQTPVTPPAKPRKAHAKLSQASEPPKVPKEPEALSEAPSETLEAPEVKRSADIISIFGFGAMNAKLAEIEDDMAVENIKSELLTCLATLKEAVEKGSIMSLFLIGAGAPGHDDISYSSTTCFDKPAVTIGQIEIAKYNFMIQVGQDRHQVDYEPD